MQQPPEWASGGCGGGDDAGDTTSTCESTSHSANQTEPPVDAPSSPTAPPPGAGRPDKAAVRAATTTYTYADAAPEYFERGWHPLPLFGGKGRTPGGTTGYAGALVTEADIARWSKSPNVTGLCLRLVDMVGLDVDAYKKECEWSEVTASLPPLPKTWISSSRFGDDYDGVSGIRIYRLPAAYLARQCEVCWFGGLGEGIDIVRFGHRQVNAWPQVHPGRGVTYQWLNEETGEIVDGPIPCRPEKIPELPEAWAASMIKPEHPQVAQQTKHTKQPKNTAPPRTTAPHATPEQRAEVEGWWTDVEPCPAVQKALDDILDRLPGDRHDTAVPSMLRLTRLGEQGHQGVREAIGELRDAFITEREGDEYLSEPPEDEWSRAEAGIYAQIDINGFTAPEKVGCCGSRKDGPGGAAGGVNRDAAAARRLDVIRADQVKLTRVRYLYDKRIPLRAMTLMPGEEGIGKTTVGVRIIADVTRGTLPGECYGTPRDVVVLSLEDGLSDVYVPRLDEAGADRSRVHIVRAVIGEDGDKDGVILPRDLDRIGELVRSVDAVMVWVDSLVTTLPDELKSISYKDTAKVLKALGGWAEAEGLAVVAPWHLNKASGSNTALRIMDSRAFRTAVRSMLIVVKDPDAPEGVSQGLVVLDKANAGTLNVPGLRYRIRSAPYVVEELDEATGEIREITASCGVADWVGEMSAAVAQDAARRALEPRIDKDNDPREWLKEYLADRGRSKRQDVLSAAKLAGFSDSAMKRAARSLAIRSTQETGQHPGGTPFREALWELPEDLLPSSGVTQSGQAHDTHPTGPTDPTGEGVCDPIDPVSPSQLQSGQ